ncbi:MAG: acyl-CoA thioesterase [Gemmatimonadota bacterium]
MNAVDRTRLRVRYAETDQMGRAHHAAYLVWMELGRTSLMRRHGISYAELEASGLLLPVSRVELEYRRGARFEDPVEVRTRVAAVRSRSVAFEYEIVAADGDEMTVARGRTELVCTDAVGRPRRLPEALRETLSGMATETKTGTDEG